MTPILNTQKKKNKNDKCSSSGGCSCSSSSSSSSSSSLKLVTGLLVSSCCGTHTGGHAQVVLQKQNHRRPVVVCVNRFELPTDPDEGCTSEAPLCFADGERRPPYGHPGTHCRPYPCTNTNHHHGLDANNDNTTTSVVADKGCSVETPNCVDGLGNDPFPNAPGMYCVADKNGEDTTSTGIVTSPTLVATSSAAVAWGLSSTKTTHALTNNDDQDERDTAGKVLIFADRTRRRRRSEEEDDHEDDRLRCLISGLTVPPMWKERQPQQNNDNAVDHNQLAVACSTCPVTQSCKLGQSLGW